MLNIHKDDYLYHWVTKYLQSNKDKAVTIDENVNFQSIPLFQNSNDVMLNVI